MDQPIVISMPLSYWEEKKNFWHIKPEWLDKAKTSETGDIAKTKDTILKIGKESNRK